MPFCHKDFPKLHELQKRLLRMEVFRALNLAVAHHIHLVSLCCALKLLQHLEEQQKPGLHVFGEAGVLIQAIFRPQCLRCSTSW